ncbi:NAD-binding Rossmann fold oxidoreductase [Ascosphaera apis ARSEF 7405]|uniref:NAD-binding Rossmann fold oxidoreductase n=1 Tax=Ascosphaera apis ARSEF 7405 TaxID=392613 RepID=A0A168CQP5_9EURO|nr:NAD-binding Rossmann fold oxidoreductase [Ascosphaera apis ARSEF 7405]
MKPVTIVVVGAGQRGQTYAQYALDHPDLAKVVAVVEPRPHRRIPEELQFTEWKSLIARGKIADAVIIAMLDNLHAEAVADFSALGYHILCEKPMATSIADCVQMFKNVTEVLEPKIFGMGHVLRYSPYNRAVKEVIDSGALGDIINIQHIEPVGNQHFSHSYVRGNWHKESESSFSLMTKCCHDIDVLSFYLNNLQPKRVQSFGSLAHFKKSRKPVEAGDALECLDCPYESNCVWSAKKIYIEPLGKEGQEQWARHFVEAEVLDIENVTQALRKTQYGRCVYECPNDVVDHQVVNIEYEDGVTANMTMVAFTEAECNRGTRIHGTKGELTGDMNTFDVFDFLTRKKTHYAPPSEGGYHGGGDTGLARAFVKAVAEKNQAALGVTPEEVLDSHLLVFAAEQARKTGTVVDFNEFKEKSLQGDPLVKPSETTIVDKN